MACQINNDPATLQDLNCLAERAFNYIIPFAGLAAFVVLIIGGFQYLTAGADPKKAQQARAVITGAIVGIVVTLSVYLIFRLLGVITGLDLLQFAIPGTPAQPAAGQCVTCGGSPCCTPGYCMGDAVSGACAY